LTLLRLENALLLDPEREAPALGTILVEGGRIRAVLRPGEPAPEAAERVDLAGRALAPGFLDLHFHGELVFAAARGMPDVLARSARALLRHGTTAFLPTSVAWPSERLGEFVRSLAKLAGAGDGSGAAPLGIHLEGPWINPAAAGAQPKRGIRAFEAREGEDLLAWGEGQVRMVTLAPEVEGAAALIEQLARRGVVAALGHSLAGEREIDAAARAGVSHVTHLFNAMGALHHREPGVPGCVLGDERLSCDLICDGAHVHPRVVRLAAQLLGARLALITDRIALPEPSRPGEAPDPSFGSGVLHDDGTALRLPDGRLAGSSLSLDRAMRNLQRFAARPRLDAVAACTLRPARILGCESERGTLRPGARADFAILDAEDRVRETWIAGRPVWRTAQDDGSHPPRA